MESNNWRTTQTQSDQQTNTVQTVDWRSSFSSNSRRLVLNKILESLKKHYPVPVSELNVIVAKFEEKVYSLAPSLDDYMRKISVKLLAIDSNNQNIGAGSLATNPANSSLNALEAVRHSTSVQKNDQGLPDLMTLTDNQPEALQQMLAPNLPASITSAGVQSFAGLSSTLPPVSDYDTNQGSLPNLINQSSNTQTMAGASQKGFVNSVGNGVASNVVNNQKEVQGRQQVTPGHQHLYMNQQQPQQFIRPKQPHQGVLPNSVMQSVQQQQQQHSLQQNQMQSSQQAGNPRSNDVLQQRPQSVLRQQQHYPQQDLLLQRQQVTLQSTQLSQSQQQLQTSRPPQLLMGQQTNPTNLTEMRQQQHRLIAQQMGHQSNTSGLQQKMDGTQSCNSVMNPNQPHMNLVHQTKGPLHLQNQQSAPNLLTIQGQHSQSPLMSQMQSESAQLRQHLGVNQQQHAAHQRLQPSGTSMQSQMQSHNTGDQIYQSQREQPAVSSDSIPQIGHSSSANWQEEVHAKITSLKDLYFTEIQNMYQKVSYKLQQANHSQLEKLHWVQRNLRETIKFLSVDICDVTPAHREKFPIIENYVVTVINSQRSRRPDQGPPPMQSIQQVKSHENHLNTLTQSSYIQRPRMMDPKTTSLQQNPVSSLSGASNAQVNMSGNLKLEPNVDVGQGSGLASLQQRVGGSLQQTNMNALSMRNGINLVRPNISGHQSANSVNQPHIREQQAMQSQKLRHQIQQPHQQMLQKQQQTHQKSRHHQQAELLSAHQVPQLKKTEKINEVNIGQGFGAKIGTFSQRLGTAVGQTSVYHQLKSGVSFPISSLPMPQTSSLQNFQKSSPEVDQQNMPVSFSKSGTPPRSANSPITVPSQSTPLAPSPLQGDSEKLVSNVSPLTTAGNIRVQQPEIPYAATEGLAIENSSGVSASPLLTELSKQEISHGNISTAVAKSSITEDPLDRLIKTVKSISNEALTASVNDIRSILSMIDKIAGSAPGNGSGAAVGEDLSAMTMCRLQAENLASHGKSSRSRLMKRCTSSMPSAVLTNGSSDYSFTQLVGSELSDSESTATSRVKRPRTEVNYSLLREISYINQQLIDTMVHISEEDPFFAAEIESKGSTGVIVKCSYNAVALSPALKSQCAKTQLSPIQPLRLLVPSNYPNCSPVLLDKLPVTTSSENEDLSMKAKSKLSRSLCTLSQPMSLNEIAKTWDFCTRAVISEYAQARGGGSFSSIYGSWESVF